MNANAPKDRYPDADVPFQSTACVTAGLKWLRSATRFLFTSLKTARLVEAGAAESDGDLLALVLTHMRVCSHFSVRITQTQQSVTRDNTGKR